MHHVPIWKAKSTLHLPSRKDKIAIFFVMITFIHVTSYMSKEKLNYYKVNMKLLSIPKVKPLPLVSCAYSLLWNSTARKRRHWFVYSLKKKWAPRSNHLLYRQHACSIFFLFHYFFFITQYPAQKATNMGFMNYTVH